MQLSTTQIEIIKNIINDHINNSHKLYLYGSRARKSAWKFSDVDLCLDGDLLSYQVLAAIKEKFSESNLPYFVDIVQKQKLNSKFFALIEPDLIQISLH